MATLTTNKNFLSPIGFQFVIDRSLFPNLEYYCTSVTLPSLAISESPVPFKATNMAFTGDRLDFSELSITFNVTENMENYIETFDWMHRCVNDEKDQTADGSLTILTSHSNPGKIIKFFDLFPTNLDALTFDAKLGTLEYLTATVTFAYTSFEFKT